MVISAGLGEPPTEDNEHLMIRKIADIMSDELDPKGNGQIIYSPMRARYEAAAARILALELAAQRRSDGASGGAA